MHFIPTYVYVLLCALVYLGVRRCFPRTMRPERLLVFPLGFLALGAASLDRAFPGADISMDAVSLAMLALGAGLGWLHASRWSLQFKITGNRLKVRVPGDPSLLVTLLLSFVCKFIEGYAMAVHAPWSTSLSFKLLSFAMWGILAGLPLGRAINVVLRSIAARAADAGTPSFE
ncbi:MAG: hypothetical protein KGQ57_04160 [Burkholderiales bacterium]|nr:hypothetical protein [Burkholderiales bacterium]